MIVPCSCLHHWSFPYWTARAILSKPKLLKASDASDREGGIVLKSKSPLALLTASGLLVVSRKCFHVPSYSIDGALDSLSVIDERGCDACTALV